MICSNCYKSFDGIGSYCPACRPHASAQTAQANFNSAGLQNESDRGIYPAGMVGRIVAFIFDSLLLALIINVILVPFFAGFIVEYLTKGILDAFSGGSKNAIIFLMASILISTFSVVILIALFSPLYYILFESSALQGTPGKLLVGLKVTNMQSERLSITRAFLRLIARWIGVVPLILLLFLAPIAAYFQVPSLVLLAFSLFFLSPIIFLMTYPLAFFTHYKQGLHDLISSCVVQ